MKAYFDDMAWEITNSVVYSTWGGGGGCRDRVAFTRVFRDAMVYDVTRVDEVSNDDKYESYTILDGMLLKFISRTVRR